MVWLGVPADSQIACTSNSDCPNRFTCKTNIGRCASIDGDAKGPALLAHAFALAAPYLPGPGEHANFGMLSPEASRRARALAVWATLRAYGRSGYRAMVERHLDLAKHLAACVDAAPDLERVADVTLNIVAFRYQPDGVDDAHLDALNARIGDAILADGRIYMGTTRYRDMTVFRPAIVNWRTTEADVELIVTVVRELGARLR